ncbi:hypothetical protein BDAP_002016 [Binucleata daphniae]
MPLRKLEITAIILVGGVGTRLRPLTYTVCKPMLQFVDKPILVQQIDELYSAGIRRIILATSIKHKIEADLMKYIDYEDLFLIFSEENEVMGTAGAIKNAEKFITYPCIILNGDIICKYPFYDMLDFHLESKKEATILSTTVKDPSKYGVLVTNNSNQIIKFVEKPKDYTSNKINAGVYVINRCVLSLIPKKECSIEREIFPILSNNQQLVSYDLQGYWMDVGQPKDFINGIGMFIKHNKMFLHDNKMENATYYKTKRLVNVYEKTSKDMINFYNLEMTKTFEAEKSFIDDSALIAEGTSIGPNVVICKNVKIGKYVHINNSIIFDNVTIADSCCISNSIIGWNSKIGRWVHITETTVLGKDTVVEDNVLLCSYLAMPGSKITKNEIGSTNK